MEYLGFVSSAHLLCSLLSAATTGLTRPARRSSGWRAAKLRWKMHWRPFKVRSRTGGSRTFLPYILAYVCHRFWHIKATLIVFKQCWSWLNYSSSGSRDAVSIKEHLWPFQTNRLLLRKWPKFVCFFRQVNLRKSRPAKTGCSYIVYLLYSIRNCTVVCVVSFN